MSCQFPPPERARFNSIGCSDDDSISRKERNRERNKEHARKTRLRKKEALQQLKDRVTELEDEGNSLRSGIQECSVASILVGLSCGKSSEDGEVRSSEAACLISQHSFTETLNSGKRKRFLSLDHGDDPVQIEPMELKIRGQVTLVGGSCHDYAKVAINWKTGVYVDEKGVRQQLTKNELEELRRERNRMHAKMTRDRKKAFISSLKSVVSKLEEENQHLRDTLERSRALAPPEEKPQEVDVASREEDGNDSKHSIICRQVSNISPISPQGSPSTNLTQSKECLTLMNSSRAFFAVG